jgi:hypothetical protein
LSVFPAPAHALSFMTPRSTGVSPAAEALRVRESDDAGAWDAAIWAHPKGNIFCAAPWGAYKRRLGWRVRRLAISDGRGELLALVQVADRRQGLIRAFDIQGSPLLTGSGEREAEAVIERLLDHLAPGPFDPVAIRFQEFQTPGGALALLAKGFVPVVTAKDHTFEVDLDGGLDAVLRNAEQQWRKEVRRAERSSDLCARFLDDPEERLACFDAFSLFYADLKQRKGFRSSLDCAAYRDLAAGDPHLLFLEIRDKGERVLVRIAHLSAERCTDFLTASSAQARTSGAATLSVHRIVERGIAAGCRVFDFGGIDPAGNRGVYDFKRKLTRNVVQTGPVWLYGRSALARRAAATWLALR